VYANFTLLRKPFKTLPAFTEIDRGIRIVFSRITIHIRMTIDHCSITKTAEMNLINISRRDAAYFLQG
jgi:hypothetical protein